MIGHDPRHDPTVDHAECFVCAGALAAAFTKLADLDLGPRNTSALIRRLRELAFESIARGAAS